MSTTDLVDEAEDDDYLEKEEEEEIEVKEEKPSTPASVPSFSSTSSLNIFPTEAVVPTTTEYFEPEISNTPPVIKSRLPKQQLTAGKPFG